MNETNSEFIKHEPCPQCQSRNNLARYSDGHGWCFGCGYREPADGGTNEFNKNRYDYRSSGGVIKKTN